MPSTNNAVLILNTGSSTLKWSVFEERRLVSSDTVTWGSASARRSQIKGALSGVQSCRAIGHRVVHGGTKFSSAVVIDAAVRAQLDVLADLDRLHMEPALAAIDAATELFAEVPQVASFDTAFHSSIPPSANYALPFEWVERWELRRFGFHGLSVSYAVERLAQLTDHTAARVIVCHLGSGCSVTAVHAGRSIDTTMGFTPLEGLMMGTRAGTVDPGLLLYLQTRHGMQPAELEEALSRSAGLLGVSGVSGDLRKVRSAAAQGSQRAALACEMFARSAQRAVGAMMAVLGGVDVIVFTGGIGENDAMIRTEIAMAVGADRLVLDERVNSHAAGDRVISTVTSPAAALVITAREDLVILREVCAVLAGKAPR